MQHLLVTSMRLPLPREQVLCLADDPATAEHMAHTVHALGAHPVLPDTTDPAAWLSRQPTPPQAALLAAAPATALAWQQALATHPGPVVPLYAWRGEPLPAGALIERSLSVNTAAAGGNASLMGLD